jgi:peptidoglycan-associated lipoprotein
MLKRIVLLFLVSLLAACSTTTLPPPPSAPAPQLPMPAAPPATEAPPPAKPVPMIQQESSQQIFERLRASLDDQSVYFDFDKSAIRQDQSSAVTEHAKLANTYANDHITLQGNCDERGGHEYNLALGQRRADAVKNRLALLGVAQSRIETVSLGKEKPRSLCHEEKCWAENRRADFIDAWK